MVDPLTDRERSVWEALLRTSLRATGLVARDLASVGLSGPEFGVLTLLANAEGRMDQGALREALGWDKSRLSHQLTRMEERHLVARSRSGTRQVEVTLTRDGEYLIAAARPVHASSVRRNFLDGLPANLADALLELSEFFEGPQKANGEHGGRRNRGVPSSVQE